MGNEILLVFKVMDIIMKNEKCCTTRLRDNTLMIIAIILLVVGVMYYLKHHDIKMNLKIKDDSGNKSNVTVKHE